MSKLSGAFLRDDKLLDLTPGCPSIPKMKDWMESATLSLPFLFLLFLRFIYFMLCYESFVCMCVCAPHMCGTCWGQKIVLELLRWEFQIVISHHEDAGKKPGSCGRASSACNHWAISPFPLCPFQWQSCLGVHQRNWTVTPFLGLKLGLEHSSLHFSWQLFPVLLDLFSSTRLLAPGWPPYSPLQLHLCQEAPRELHSEAGGHWSEPTGTEGSREHWGHAGVGRWGWQRKSLWGGTGNRRRLWIFSGFKVENKNSWGNR